MTATRCNAGEAVSSRCHPRAADGGSGWKAVQLALGSVVFRDAAQNLTPRARGTVMAGRFLGPILLAIAVLAVRASANDDLAR